MNLRELLLVLAIACYAGAVATGVMSVLVADGLGAFALAAVALTAGLAGTYALVVRERDL